MEFNSDPMRKTGMFPVVTKGVEVLIWQTMLTEHAAVEIYKMKVTLLQQRNTKEPFSIWGKTRSVAKLFGVNSRTIKYVWNRQTWSHATEYLWASESELQKSNDSRLHDMVTS